MIGALLNIPGRVQVLLTRITAARSANLDNLNAPLSLVAPASSALSTAVWTQAHADAIVSGGTGSRSKALEYGVGAFTFSVPANVAMVFVTLQGPGGAGGRNATGGSGGGGSGELIRRQPYKVTPSGTVAGSVGVGVNNASSQNSAFGTLVAHGGRGAGTSNAGSAGGGSMNGAPSGNQGTALGFVLGGGSGGAVGAAGAPCGQYAGGAGLASEGGGGAASYFAAGGAAAATTPAKPGIGAGAGGTKSGAAFATGGDGYALIEWIG